jgi:hypothetical protein
MARYFAFLGLQVEVQYRAGDILLPASGTFVGDTGRSIFLEQSLEQKGQHRNFRWEIPYPCIVRLVEKSVPEGSSGPDKPVRSDAGATQGAQTTNAKEETERSEQQKSDVDGLQVSIMFPRPQRSNI